MAWLCLSNGAHAVPTIYYVATTGNDANPCSLASPCLTIAHGVALLFASDTLYIRGGTYTGSANVISSDNTVRGGTSWADAITIAAFPGETVTIQPPNHMDVVGFNTPTQKYLIFDHLIMDCVNQTGSTDTCVYIGGAGGGLAGSGAGYIRIQDCEIKNSSFVGIMLPYHGAGYNEILRNSIHNIGDDLDPAVEDPQHGTYINSGHNLIEGNDFFANMDYGVHIYGTVDASFNVVRGNRVHGNGLSTHNFTSYGILVATGHDNLVVNNLVWGNRGGIQIGGEDQLIYQNTVYNNDIVGGGGILIQASSTRAVVKNNISYGNTFGDITNFGGISPTIAYNLTGDTQPSPATNKIESSNPLFTDAAGANFTIQTGSPAKDAGTNLSVTTDFRGGPRPFNLIPDIGAYEYGAVATFTPTTTADLGTLIARTDLRCGDTINLPPLVTIAAQVALPVVVNWNGTPCSAATAYVTLQTTPSGSQPTAGTRTNPSYAPYLAIIQPTGGNQSALLLGAHVNGWKFINLSLQATTAASREGASITIGSDTEPVAANQPTDIIMDRLLIQGHPTLATRRGVADHGQTTQLINSYLDNFKHASQEAQAYASWNGPGHHLVENNFLEGSTQPVLVGGSDPGIIGMNPTYTFRRNYMTKRDAWNPNHPSWDHSTWYEKNCFEIKKGINVLIELNIVEKCWQGGQDGTAFLVSILNQGGSDPTAILRDVIIRYNIIRHGGNVMGVTWQADGHTTLQGYNLQILHNLGYDIGSALYPGSTAGETFPIFNGFYSNVSIKHNTFIPSAAVPYRLLQFVGDPALKITGLDIQNNLWVHGYYGVKGTDNVTTYTAGDALDHYATAATFTCNVLAGIEGSPGIVAGDYSHYPGNFFPSRPTFDAQFVNPAAGNFRLIGGSVYAAGGPSQACDGTAQGVDMSLLPDPAGDASGGAVGGAPTPPTPVKLPLPISVACAAQTSAPTTVTEGATVTLSLCHSGAGVTQWAGLVDGRRRALTLKPDGKTYSDGLTKFVGTSSFVAGTHVVQIIPIYGPAGDGPLSLPFLLTVRPKGPAVTPTGTAPANVRIN